MSGAGDLPTDLDELADGPEGVGETAQETYRALRDALEEHGGAILDDPGGGETHIVEDGGDAYRIAFEDEGRWHRFGVVDLPSWVQLKIILSNGVEGAAPEETRLSRPDGTLYDVDGWEHADQGGSR